MTAHPPIAEASRLANTRAGLPKAAASKPPGGPGHRILPHGAPHLELRGGVGLVELFRDSPFPDVMARRLLELALEDFTETGFHYLLYLVMSRAKARRVGTTQEVEALDDQLHEYAIDEQFPQQWHLDYLFSKAGYDTYGGGLLPLWAAVLIQLCTLEQQWEGALLGYRRQKPYLAPGSQPHEEVSPAA